MFDYNNAFNRNIGILTEEEQLKIKNTKVAIAGLGGIGGSIFLCLVRIGFENFHLADLDEFDQANSNRQVGATTKTYGQHKAEVMKQMGLDINPNLQAKVFVDGVNEENVDEFLSGRDFALDCIDYFCLNARCLLQNEAEKRKITTFFAAPIGMSASILCFSPDSMSFNQYFNLKDEDSKFTKILKFTVGIVPKALHSKYVDFSRERIVQMKTGPSISSAVNLAVGMIATEIISYSSGKRKPLLAPRSHQFDAFRHKYGKANLVFGNAGPLQKIKLWLAQRIYKESADVFEEFVK
ncbi:MAG: ThiF family adenylyltransferase [Bdellovibrionales bacterium]